MRAGRHGFYQLIRQEGIQHADLIDHHQVGREWIVRPPAGLTAGAQLQQPVQGPGWEPRGLLHPLGRPTGRRGQQAGQALRPGQC